MALSNQFSTPCSETTASRLVAAVAAEPVRENAPLEAVRPKLREEAVRPKLTEAVRLKAGLQATGDPAIDSRLLTRLIPERRAPMPDLRLRRDANCRAGNHLVSILEHSGSWVAWYQTRDRVLKRVWPRGVSSQDLGVPED